MGTTSAVKVTVQPRSAPWIDAAVQAGGGVIVPPEEADVAVWTASSDPEALGVLVRDHPHLAWVQLPWAGVEPYVRVMDRDRLWTCAKGVYAPPVAEHALALLLAGLRALPAYARERTWSQERPARNLIGSRVVIVGAGGITTELLGLLAPFGVEATVVRRTPDPVPGAARVVAVTELDSVLPEADALVLALALTPETRHLIGRRQLALLPSHAWLVNVARGGHVDTDALVEALDAGEIGGAALDVTDPEPLPERHPLWSLPNVLITPHTANTREMAKPLLGARITENLRRYRAGEPLLGPVDLDLGY